MARIFIAVLLFISFHVESQVNVRAWYADGQVWIVWNIELPLPETVMVYASDEAFTNTSNATLIGRPFHLDYLPVALKEQVDTSMTFRIPNGLGGKYQLGLTEGLFVFTPHASGEKYFAVVAEGENNVVTGVNITDAAVPFTYEPFTDPVECHLQTTFPSPFSPGQYVCFAYMMWVDGRDNYWESRPDFPVMANAAKNGMPGFFFVSAPITLDTTKPFALSVWLHGGGGTAIQSLAGSRPIVNINPKDGILVAHNDDVYGKRGTTPPFIENPSLHFGWRKNWDPFNENNLPTQPDTIINYTQRRYLWTDQWLIKNFNIDPARVHIQGHSMGSWGATGMAKVYPEHYASAVLFNNGFRGPDPGTNIAAMFGETADHFPTNIKNRNGEVVYHPFQFDIITNTSSERDLPIFRSFHSKNDVGDANFWGFEVVDNYRIADAAGHGMALYWSERAHGIDTGPDFNDHWVNGNTSTTQTATDNVAWGEAHYRTDMSYPAFHNHRLDPTAHDPGDGTQGTGPSGVGDDWGTWGGWHRWDPATILDEASTWSVEAWLESNAVFENDNSPHDQLTADMAIRRPQVFKPMTGDMIHWKAEDVNSGAVLQSGTTTILNDDLVILPGIILYAETLRRVKITVTKSSVSTNDNSETKSDFIIYPNPFSKDFILSTAKSIDGTCSIQILTMNGTLINEFLKNVQQGKNELLVSIGTSIPPGVYILRINTGESVEQKMIIKK